MKIVTQKEFNKLLGENSYQNNIPITGQFELTPLCNLDCKMCYVHLQDSSVKNKILTGKQWISIMKDAVDNGMIDALLTGGEALTHPDFWMIYEFLIESGVNVRIKTNGILLNEENVERLRKYQPNVIDVSLYGCDSKSYLAVTGRDVFDVVTANINRVIDAGLHLRLKITTSVYIKPWLDQLMEYAKSFGVEVSVNTLLLDADEETGREKADFDLTVEERLRISEKSNELFPKRTTPEEERVSERNTKRPDVSEKGLYCKAGRTCFAVSWDGIMRPCLIFPREMVCEHPLVDGFESAWGRVNMAIKDFKVPMKCHSCEINSKCHYCPAYHRKYAISYQCDEKVCEYMKGYLELQDKHKQTYI